jgi:hypothetical protein
VNRDRRERRVAMLLLITSVLWLHQWFPALLVVAWVSWLILHKQLEGSLGEALVGLWRRRWPPGTLALIPLLTANALAYWVYAPMPGRIMPFALNLLALSILLFGGLWDKARSLWGAPRETVAPGSVSDLVTVSARPKEHA